MSISIKADARTLEHDNFATSTSDATKTPTVPANFILIENMDAVISVLVSFDGGTTYKTVKAGSVLSMDVDNLKTYVIKSASGTPNVEALYGSEG